MHILRTRSSVYAWDMVVVIAVAAVVVVVVVVVSIVVIVVAIVVVVVVAVIVIVVVVTAIVVVIVVIVVGLVVVVGSIGTAIEMVVTRLFQGLGNAHHVVQVVALVRVSSKVFLEVGLQACFVSIFGFFITKIRNLLLVDTEMVVVIGNTVSLLQLMELHAIVTRLVWVPIAFLDVG